MMAADQNFHNKIAEICLNCFETLSKSGKPSNNEWTVLSCIVLQLESNFTVVALGTGSKCIGKSKMSIRGDILNDSHAEVMCRRAFLRYLYDQMKEDSILVTFDTQTQKYILNSDAKFHFFTTHVPCGDAAIFPKQNSEDFGEVIITDNEEISSKKIKLDINRTGAKCLNKSDVQDLKLPGVNYHAVGVVRTKPGRGDPTLSVSCSDKLAKWCHLGLQGALLSILLKKPIYISTFTILSSSPFCKKALNRALFDRLVDIQLHEPYLQTCVEIGTSCQSFKHGRRAEKRPCSTSIAWCKVTEKSFEVAVEGRRQGVTKKKLDTPSGRLKICKLELFKLFKEICSSKQIELGGEKDLNHITYDQAKRYSTDYQNSWNILRRSFKTWTNKDCLLQFF